MKLSTSGLLLCIFSAEVWWSHEDKVVFQCNNFPPSAPIDGCEWNRGKMGWGQHNINSVLDPSGRTSDSVLRVFYPRGSYTFNPDNRGGCQFRAYPFNATDGATLQYDVYFSKNFDFVQGGKLPGFFGGTGKCAGGLHDTSCFSSRFHFRENGIGEVYAYIPNDESTWFCNLPHVKCNLEYGHSFGRGVWRFKTGRWYTLAMHVQLNTPAHFDGLIRVHVNGKFVYEIRGLKFREDYSIKVDQLLFTTFFGGSEPDWASTDDVYTYFRKFRVTI